MNNKVNALNERLADTLLLDLDDPNKCTPGLYQIIRGYINDNREALDGLPNEALDHLEKMTDAIPFRRQG